VRRFRGAFSSSLFPPPKKSPPWSVHVATVSLLKNIQERIDIIEAQLAHQVSDALGRAYNHTSFLKERRALMSRWGSYLAGLKSGAKVIPLKRGTA
jgi:hypothetical protein